MSMLSVRAVIAIVVLFISACCCCVSPPSPGASRADLPHGTPAVAVLTGEVVSYDTTSYGDPAPAGTFVSIGTLAVAVTESVRPADSLVETENRFNAPAEPGNEYVMVNISVECHADQSDTCNINPVRFSLVGSQGIMYNDALVVIPNCLYYHEMYSGSTLSGWMCFQVDRSETGLMLVYEVVPTWGQGKAFLSLP